MLQGLAFGKQVSINYLVLNDVHKYMLKNVLHINMNKSVHMHFRPNLNASERLTCAKVRKNGSENILKIGNKKLKKVDKVKFLGVIIDNKLNWEPHVDHLTKKLNSSIVLIKRVIKFIPKSEYMTIYDALFKSHLSYCISSLGQYLTRSCKVCLIYRKDVFACYLVLSTHMTIAYWVLCNVCTSTYLPTPHVTQKLLS